MALVNRSMRSGEVPCSDAPGMEAREPGMEARVPEVLGRYHPWVGPMIADPVMAALWETERASVLSRKS